MEKDELLGELMEFVEGQFWYSTFIDYMEEKGYSEEEINESWERIQSEL